MLDNPSQTIEAIHSSWNDADETEEYDQRRQRILEYVHDLKILEQSQ